MFFKYVDRTATKNEIRDALIELAKDNGEFLSTSRANNLADKFKKGHYDPDLMRIVHYSDPVGEEATACADAGQPWHKECRNCEAVAPFHPNAARFQAVAA